VTSDPTAAGGASTPGVRAAFRRGARNAAPTAPITPDAQPADPPPVKPPPAKAPSPKKSATPAALKPSTQEPPVAPAPSPPVVPTAQPTVAVTSAPEPVSPGTVVPPAPPGAVPVQRGPRKARLQIRQVDPWSVMKLGFLLSLALGIVFVVAVALLWSLLDSGGVFDSINKVVADVANDQTDFTVQGSLAFRRVMGVTLVLAVVQVVLITALATLAAFLYNLAAGLVGGLDVTLVEES